MEMDKRYTIWLILGAYGVWFAVFSGLEEISHGKYWKPIMALIFGLITYWIVENRLKK